MSPPESPHATSLGAFVVRRSTAWTLPLSMTSLMALYTDCCRFSRLRPSNVSDTTYSDTCIPFGSSSACAAGDDDQSITSHRLYLDFALRQRLANARRHQLHGRFLRPQHRRTLPRGGVVDCDERRDRRHHQQQTPQKSCHHHRL